MTAIIKKVKCSTKSIKDKCMDFYKNTDMYQVLQ